MTFFIILLCVALLFCLLLIINLRKKLWSAVALIEAKAETSKFTYDYLADEINDNIGIAIVISSHNLYNLKTIAEQEREEKLQEAEDYLANALDDIYSLSEYLSRDGIKNNGLFPELDQIVDDYNSNGLNITLNCEGDYQDLDVDREHQIYFMVNQFLENMLRHAKASKVDILLSYHKHHLEMTIKEDGAGIGYAATDMEGSDVVLRNVHTRARSINGKLNIDPVAGEGTTISLRVPYTEVSKSLFW